MRAAADLVRRAHPDAKPALRDVFSGASTAPPTPTPRTASGSAPTLRFEWLSDFSARPDFMKKEWLIKDLFGAGELSVVYGRPGAGKSAIVGDACIAIASGADWFGRTVMQGGGLYWAGERRNVAMRRLVAAARDRGLDLRALPLAVSSDDLDLVRDDTAAERVIATADEMARRRGIPVRLIVIDTKSRALGGADENDGRDVGKLVAGLDLIRRRTGAHVIVVDHLPHAGDGTRPRGHVALLAGADATFAVAATGSARTLSVIKSSDGPDDVRLAFALRSAPVTDDDAGEETHAAVVDPLDNPPASKKAGKPAPHVERSDALLAALQDAIAAEGHDAPDGTRLVAEDAWCARSRLIFANLTDESFRRKFNQWRDRLVNRGLVARIGSCVRLVAPDTVRTLSEQAPAIIPDTRPDTVRTLSAEVSGVVPEGGRTPDSRTLPPLRGVSGVRPPDDLSAAVADDLDDLF